MNDKAGSKEQHTQNPGATKQKTDSKFIVNWRGTFSLYFSRYFFVILIGVDQRQSTLDVVQNRRQRAFFASNVLFFLFVIFPYVLLFLVFLYFLKQMLGIDIFPGIHMPNFVKDIMKI
jgi:hypothetical protein